MKIVSWNIRLGGGSRIDAVADRLIRSNGDILIIGEYMKKASEPLIKKLSLAGWPYSVLPDTPDRRGGVAVLSREPIERLRTPAAMSEGYRYISVAAPLAGLELRAVYAPLQNDPFQEFWEGLLGDLNAASTKPVLLIGDLNSGLPKVDTNSSTLFCSEYFCQLPSSGYTDLWRHMNDAQAEWCTWMGPVHPYRLDHAFGSAAIVNRLRGCSYDHSVRLDKTSDHSLLSVQLE